MVALLLLSTILVFHNLPLVLSLAEGDNCETPNKERAICTGIRNCSVIIRAISTESSEAINFARKSQCGYSNQPLVCCGSSGLAVSNSTPDSNLILQHRLLPGPSECGQGNMVDKVYYEGEMTGLKEFPWMALLFYSDDDKANVSHQCAGSLINKRYVLTAAHCVKLRVSATDYKTLVSVRLGEHNTATSRDCEGPEGYQICNLAPVDYRIESEIVHEAYSQKEKVNDIALLRLNKDVTFTDHIQPVCLPAESVLNPPIGTNMTLIGWAIFEETEKFKAKVTVVSQQLCVHTFGDRAANTDKQYCAQRLYLNNKCVDICKGYSGCPSARVISQPGQFQWIQEGITSFGVTTCGLHYPDVYTRVSKYAKWITDNMID